MERPVSALTAGIFAHVDTGKTTFSEQVLYHAGVIRRAGRVDHQDATLDADPMEKRRGITIFSDQAVFEYGGRRVFWVDTPGHVDFSPEAQRAMDVLDVAILLVSAVDGVQSHTRTLWRELNAHGLPVALFINKCDRENADAGRVCGQLRAELSADILPLRLPLAGFDEAAREQLAVNDDALLEAHLAGGASDEDYLGALRQQFAQRKVFPCFSGSALRDEGVDDFMKALVNIAPQADGQSADFSGRVYKIRHDGATRLTFIKVLSGRLNTRDMVDTISRDGQPLRQKVTDLRLYTADKYAPVKTACAGELCALTGIEDCQPGDVIGAGAQSGRGAAVRPALSAAVLRDEKHTDQQLMAALRVLEQEEPTLSVDWDSQHAQARVAITGKMMLDVIKEQLSTRLAMDVKFSECAVMYTETIAAPVIGVGHYEPLRHYAEVVLRLEPMPRGSGITFESEAHVDVLPLQYQSLIRTHVFEKTHRGALIGAPLTDVKVVLVAGRFHLKHTEGGDFREATYRALRQALMHAQNLLLEPVSTFDISVPNELSGRVCAELSKLHAALDAPEPRGSETGITGEMPASAMLRFSDDFALLTHGAGGLSFTSEHSDVCENAEAVTAAAGYDPLADVENTPNSVFCSHGAGFTVIWDKVPDFCHCEEGKQAL